MKLESGWREPERYIYRVIIEQVGRVRYAYMRMYEINSSFS
jgi:hypothetical protein